MATTMTGTIRQLQTEKSFGFIQTAEGDFFFHRSAVQSPYNFSDLRIGQQVEFEPDQRSPKGPRAEQVRVRE